MSKACVGHAVAHSGWALAYVVTSAAEVVLVKALNYAADVRLPIYTALLVNQMWLVALPSLWWQCRRRRRAQRRRALALEDDHQAEALVTVSQGQPVSLVIRPRVTFSSAESLERSSSSAIRIDSGRGTGAAAAAGGAIAPADEQPSLRLRALVYAATGLLTYGITLCRNLGVNALPGSVFALLVATSIVFNIGLSKVFLQRRLNRWHGLAATLCLAAAGVAGVAGASKPGAGADSADGSGNSWLVGIPTTLGAVSSTGSSWLVGIPTTLGAVSSAGSMIITPGFQWHQQAKAGCKCLVP